MQLTGNTILITGGTSGIGLAMAIAFLEKGNTVLITGRDEQRLNDLQHRYPQLKTFKGDLTERNFINSLASEIEEHFPQLNILINNAGVQYNYLFTEEADVIEKINYEVDLNLKAPMLLTCLLLPTLSRNNQSAIVNVSSGLAIAPKKNGSVYCATKAGLRSYSRTLRYQLEHSSVKVFDLIPALIDTPMTEGRGKGKISPQQLVAEFLKKLSKNRYEIYIGKTRLLKWIYRIAPSMAYRIMKNGL